MVKAIAAAAVLVAAIVVGSASAAGTAGGGSVGGPPAVNYDGGEAGYLCQETPFDYNLQATCYEGSESYDWYGWDGSAYRRKCRTVVHNRRMESWPFGTTLFKYKQAVAFCWNGSIVTYFHRDRWPETMFSLVSFEGDTNNSCDSEHCEEQAGRWVAYASTTGMFKECLTWFCVNAYPTIRQWVYAWGEERWETSGT